MYIFDGTSVICTASHKRSPPQHHASTRPLRYMPPHVYPAHPNTPAIEGTSTWKPKHHSFFHAKSGLISPPPDTSTGLKHHSSIDWPKSKIPTISATPRSLSTKRKLWVRFFTQIIPKKNCVVFYNTLGTSQFRSPIGGKVATESSPFFGRFSTTGISKCVLSTAHTCICVHTMDTIHLQPTKMQKDDISDPSLRPLLSKEGQTENHHFHGA